MLVEGPDPPAFLAFLALGRPVVVVVEEDSELLLLLLWLVDPLVPFGLLEVEPDPWW